MSAHLRYLFPFSKRALRICAAAVALIFWLVFSACAQAPSPAPTPTVKTEEALLDLRPDLKRGKELAHAVCTACHLFEEPEYLDKVTWQIGALMRMAPLLGVGRQHFEKRPDAAILMASGIFPKTPLITQEVWQAIRQYYIEMAPEVALPQGPRPKIQQGLPHFEARPLKYPGATAQTTMVQIDPAAKRLYVGNFGARSLDILNSAGELVSRVPVDSAPVSLTVRPEGLYVTLIGNLFPSDERKGKVALVEKVGQELKLRTILSDLPRPACSVFADLNADGREDIVVCGFGNYLGKFSWFENLGGGQYRDHPLLEWPGALNAIAWDMDKKGLPSILVILGQAREGIHLFRNEGGGEFQDSIITNFPSVFGCSHIEMADVNQDGFPDLLVTNGDNAEYPSPFKRYHGLRIFLNDGHNHFTQAWFFPLNGAYKAVAGDFDGAGRRDIAAISFFPDYQKSPEESFVYLKNTGGLSFEAFSFPQCTSGRWLTMDVNDLDGDGDLDIVLGSFAEGPQSIPIPSSLQQAWRTNGFSVLLLENKLR